MSLSRLNSFLTGSTLTNAIITGEFDNIYNNGTSLINPLTAELAAGGNDITGLDELGLNDGGNATAVGRLRRNGNNLTWHDRIGAVALQPLVGGGIFGLTLANGTDAVNDIDIAVGAAVDGAEGTLMRLTSGITKRLDASWSVGTNAGGLDTGSIGNKTYHVYIIQRVDTGVVDALFSASETTPAVMPANYTLSRRIGSVIYTGGTILAFTQDGDLFQLTTPVADVAATNPGSAAVTRTLTVPTGLNVRAIVFGGIDDTQANTAYISDLATADYNTDGQFIIGLVAASTTRTRGELYVRVNTSAQIRTRLTASGANTNLNLFTRGWLDRRGKDN